MTPEAFVAALERVQLKAVFNPYLECCPIHDLPESPKFRRNNLASVLHAAVQTRGCSLWVARDLGYRGGRRTGLPLTDEVHLPHFSHAWGGLPLQKATAGPAVAERTAAVIWGMLRQIQKPIFLWNLFPFHPHEEGDPMSNRAHTRIERQVGKLFLLEILEALRPSRVVAIGGDAALAFEELGLEHVKVRHPSYGGQRAFCEGICAAYSLSPTSIATQSKLPGTD